MNLIIFFLLVYGICNIIVYANGPFHIFIKMHAYLKEHEHNMLEEMFSCMICLPTWVGMFLSAVNLIFFPYTPFTPMNMVLHTENLWPIVIFFDGLIASAGNWLIHTFQEMMERVNSNE